MASPRSRLVHEQPSLRVSIDPGSAGTGIAVWRDCEWTELALPIHYCNYRPNKKCPEGLERILELVDRIEDALSGMNLVRVYIEEPSYFDDVSGNMTAKKGDLAKLITFYGSLCYAVHNLGIPIQPCLVRSWKGQLPKEVVERRIKELLPTLRDAKDHAWDAIGIGLWAKGYLNAG